MLVVFSASHMLQALRRMWRPQWQQQWQHTRRVCGARQLASRGQSCSGQLHKRYAAAQPCTLVEKRIGSAISCYRCGLNGLASQRGSATKGPQLIHSLLGAVCSSATPLHVACSCCACTADSNLQAHTAKGHTGTGSTWFAWQSQPPAMLPTTICTA